MELTQQEIDEMDAITGLGGVTAPLAVNTNVQSRLAELDALDGGENFTGDASAPFQATGEEGIIKGTAKAVGNTPTSTFKLVKNVASAVVNPIDTAKAVGGLVKATGAKAAKGALSTFAYTDMGQSILKAAKERGGTVEVNEDGMYVPANNAETESFDKLIQFFSDRYGSIDKLKETAIEDPVGVLADVASVFSGAGAAASGLKMTKTANAFSKVGRAADPLNAIPGAISKGASAIKYSTAGRIIEDISPTSYKMQQGQVAKALELTPGQLSTISKKSGNDVTDYIIKNNLIKESPEEIAHALSETRRVTMSEVRGEIKRVKKLYARDTLPEYKEALDAVLSDIKDTAGNAKEVARVEALANKKVLRLEDIQAAKEIIDENMNIYSKSGDVKSAVKAKGLDKLRSSMRSFIEDEVAKNTDGAVDINKLNNDVMTTYAIQEAIENQATRGLPRQYINGFSIIGASAVTAVAAPFVGGFAPLVGLGFVIGKKAMESPAYRLWTVKLLSKKPVAFVKKMTKEISEKNVSADTRKQLQEILDEAKKNTQYLESGAQVLPAMEE